MLSVDPTSQYLYMLDLYLQDTSSDWSTYYDQSMSFTIGLHLYAHMDAGSMANTTNCIDYLWDFHSLMGSTTTLCVADDTPHHPTGVGHLRVPTLGAPGFIMVCTFYMPSLLATSLSPAAITSDSGCLGYSSFAHLDGHDCCLTLHGSTSTANITFLLQLCHGLLFMHALFLPSSVSVQNVYVQRITLLSLLILVDCWFIILPSSNYCICGINALAT